MAYLAVLSASIGRRAGFAATLGVALGLLIVGLAAALGLAAVIANSRPLYEALRWAGVLYLLWLAWEAWRPEEDTLPGMTGVAPGDSRYFQRGLVTNLLNPKAGIFYLAVLPTFVSEWRPLLGQTITLSAIYVAVATATHSAIVLLADSARPWLEDQERSAIIRRVFSFLLAAIAIWLLFATGYKPPAAPLEVTRLEFPALGWLLPTPQVGLARRATLAHYAGALLLTAECRH
jgi:threonine/homoserine/homoserine lactone efflux protein